MPERTVIEWDKDDLDALGLLKVDVLGLGMLSAMQRAFRLIDDFGGLVRCAGPMCIENCPARMPAVYDMICRADTVACFKSNRGHRCPCCRRLRRAISTTW